MARLNAFRMYGSNTNDENNNKTNEIKNEVGIELLQVEEVEALNESDAENTINTVEDEKFDKARQSGAGRPPINPGLKMVPRTYKLPEEVIDAIETVMFNNRKDWDKLSISKYIANLVWKDVHNAILFDPKTGEVIKDSLDLK